MKYKLVILCYALVMALPLNAFALQGENISFTRLDGFAELNGFAQVDIFSLENINAFVGGDGDEMCIQNASLAIIPGVEGSLTIPVEELPQVAIGREASALMLGTAKIITPVNVSNFVPNHCISIHEEGECASETVLEPLSHSYSFALAVGRIEANYSTTPGLANPPNAQNMYATMDVVLYFLGFGQDCSNLLGGTIKNLPFQQRVAVPSGGFSQRTKVGDTDVRVVHMGNGIFVTSGVLAASTEKSFMNFTSPFFQIDRTCGVNHLWVARQRVLIDSDDVEEVDVVMNNSLGADCFTLISGEGSLEREYSWVSLSSAYFFARDYCTDDISVRFDQAGNPVDASGDPISFDEDGNPVDTNGDPIIGADGVPIGPNGGGGSDGSLFCNPIKVLINNTLDLAEGEEEATLTESSPGVTLGIAGLNEIPVAAFRDLETVMVQVAPGPVFRCNLIVNDADTGQPVASFDPSDAAYDAATGMAVFDLSSEGPFAPGMYDVRVGTLYRAEVYVAIPGDVNLDGTVDTADRQIVLDNLSNGGVWTTGDVNNDGVVDELDLEIVDGQLPLLGDINGDGVVNIGDIAPFIDILFGGRPTQVEADINGDGFVNIGDIGPFIDILFPQ